MNGSRAAPWLVALALLFLAVHAPRLELGYFWDDNDIILDNAPLKASPWSAWVQPMQPDKDPGKPNYYRPLPFFLLGTAGALTGFEQATGLNALHFVFSLGLAAAFFFLVRRLFDPPLAFTLAALFAVFPTNVEIFAWLSCLPDVLAVGFLFLFALALEREPERESPSPWALAALAGALLSKEGGIAAPCMALAWDVPKLRRGAWARLFSFHLPIWLVTWLYLVVHAHFAAFTPPISLSPVLPLRTLGAYAVKIVNPWPLAVLLGENTTEWTWEAALGVAVVLALAAAVVFARDRRVRLGAALMAGGFVPYANLWLPPGEMLLIAERYMAVPLGGALVLAGAAVSRLRRPAPALAALALLAAVYGLTSRMQYAVWADPLRQWTAAIEAAPRKIGPYYRRARLYAEQGRLDLARADIARSVAQIDLWQRDYGVTIDPIVLRHANRAAATVALAAGDYAAAVSYSRAEFQLAREAEPLLRGLRALDRVPDPAGALRGAVNANALYPQNNTFAVMAIGLAVTLERPELAWGVVNRSSFRYADLVTAARHDWAGMRGKSAFDRGAWIYANFKLVSPAFAVFARGATDMTGRQLAGVADLAYRERMWRESERYFALALAKEQPTEWIVRHGLALDKLDRRTEACAEYGRAGATGVPELDAQLEALRAGCATH